MPDPAQLTERASFRAWTRETARFADTDRLGHVNNAVFATFCESGRVSFLYDASKPLAPPGAVFVIARLALDFRAELHWRDQVDIGTAVLAMRRRSFTLGQGLFCRDACVAAAESVMVLMDEATRRAIELPDRLRADLAAYLAPGAT